MLVIPINAKPSQVLNVALGGQSCRINVYQKATSSGHSVYLDLYVNNVLIIGGVVCLNCVPVVRDDYLGFIGDIYFIDTQGVSDPDYSGFGSRFILAYMQGT